MQRIVDKRRCTGSQFAISRPTVAISYLREKFQWSSVRFVIIIVSVFNFIIWGNPTSCLLKIMKYGNTN